MLPVVADDAHARRFRPPLCNLQGRLRLRSPAGRTSEAVKASKTRKAFSPVSAAAA